MAKKNASNKDALNSKQLMKEMHALLKEHGITAKISEMTFASPKGAGCTCANGKKGVRAVVNGEVVCVCDD